MDVPPTPITMSSIRKFERGDKKNYAFFITFSLKFWKIPILAINIWKIPPTIPTPLPLYISDQRVGFLSVVGASKLYRFGGCPLELDEFSLLARVR